METVGVYKAEKAIIVDFDRPRGDSPSGLILLDRDPFLVEIVEKHWVDVEKHMSPEMMRNYFGAVQSYSDTHCSGGTLHLIGHSYWEEQPSIGRSFYGLVRYRDVATFSDVLKHTLGGFPKGESLENENHFTVFDSENDSVRIMFPASPTTIRQHLGYHLSHPIEDMYELPAASIREIFGEADSRVSDKVRRITTLLEDISSRSSAAPHLKLV